MIECDKCQHENPDDSRFCSQCGGKLPLDVVPQPVGDSDINEQTQKFVTQFADNIKLVATQTKYDELRDFQDQASNWVANQFRVGKIVVAVLLAVLGWLGYSSWDLKKEFENQVAAGKEEIAKIKQQYEDDIANNRQEMQSAAATYLAAFEKNLQILVDRQSELEATSKGVTGKAAEALADITAKQDEFKKLDFSQVEAYREELTREIGNVVRLKNDLESQLATLALQTAKLDKIERSRYQILLHYGGNDIERTDPPNFTDIQAALYAKGYIVDYEDIMNVSADRQEILYYSATPDMQSKVDEIIGQLADHVDGNIGKTVERSGNNDPFQIVIKLCPKGTTGGLACKL